MATAIGHTTPASYASRVAQRYLRSAPVTNFYPNYGEERAERIAPIQAARFQGIIPRYHLSTSQTRTQGTGPALYDLSIGWSSDRRDLELMPQPETVRTAYRGRSREAARRNATYTDGPNRYPERATTETHRRGLSAYRRELQFAGFRTDQASHKGLTEGPEVAHGELIDITA